MSKEKQEYYDMDSEKFHKDTKEWVKEIPLKKLVGEIHLKGEVMTERITKVNDFRYASFKKIKLNTRDITDIIEKIKKLEPKIYCFEGNGIFANRAWTYNSVVEVKKRSKGLGCVRKLFASSKNKYIMEIRRYFFNADYWTGKRRGPNKLYDKVKIKYFTKEMPNHNH